MAMFKLCRCGDKIPYSSRACDKCLPILEQKEKDRYKRYANNRTDKDIQRIYSSDRWIAVRDTAKFKQNGLDLYSYYVLGVTEYAELYHHIVETKEDIKRAYDVTNVIGLTDSNHKFIHNVYKKSLKHKKDMQELLFSLIDRYNREAS